MLAAITLLKQEVEGLEDLDRAAEILIRLLCALPGWGEKNVQVLSLILKKKMIFLYVTLMQVMRILFLE